MDTLCRLMLPESTQSIDPMSLARKGVTIEGKYAVCDLPRLYEVLQDNTGWINYRLKFGLDNDKKHCIISGNIEARLCTVCQRCLGKMELNLAAPVFVGVVSSREEEAILPEGCEPLLQGEAPILLPDFIEDEVILAMPISALHEEESCTASRTLRDINAAARNSPFAVLKGMKK